MFLERDGSDPSLLTETATESKSMMLLESDGSDPSLLTDTGLTQVFRLTQRERHRF
jgi:hypothetical protein